MVRVVGKKIRIATGSSLLAVIVSHGIRVAMESFLGAPIWLPRFLNP